MFVRKYRSLLRRFHRRHEHYEHALCLWLINIVERVVMSLGGLVIVLVLLPSLLLALLLLPNKLKPHNRPGISPRYEKVVLDKPFLSGHPMID